MKKFSLFLLLFFILIIFFFIFRNKNFSLSDTIKEKAPEVIDIETLRHNLLDYLKSRKDKLAEAEVKKILARHPQDLVALWAKAEILRRSYKFEESEKLLSQVLKYAPTYIPALISLAYIRYYTADYEAGLKLLKTILNQPNLDKEGQALAYLLVGSIHAKKAESGGWLSKVVYGLRIRSYFEKAKNLAPHLSEVCLGLGSFYLLAPSVIGGNIDKAILELESAVAISPEFATANARLAQAYRKKGNLEKYNFYLERTKELDPENEVLKEILP